MTDSTPYVGHKVLAGIIASMPLMIAVDAGSIWQRLLLSLCGGIGAALVIIADRPKSWGDAAIRVGSGVAACFLFGPAIAERFGLHTTADSLIATFGVIGMGSWYSMGSITRVLRQAQDRDVWGGLLRVWAKARLGLSLPDTPNQPAQFPESMMPKPKPPEVP